MHTPRLLAVLALLLVCATGLAAVPQMITLQGLLRDGVGDPVADGDYSVAFTVYNSAVGGTVQWAETTMVSTTSGLFTVLLGSVHPVPDSIFNDSSRYLGIKVDADPEMTPRQRLASVGYSYVSSQWTSGGGNVYRVAGRVGIGESSPVTTLHVRRTNMSLPESPALNNDDVVVEDDDAILGLYSGTGGTYGSGIVFGEVDAGVYTNKWSIFRTKTLAGSRLGFSYGSDTSYAINPTQLTLDGPNARVGIGTTLPQNRLDVEGAVVVGNSYSGSQLAPTNGLLIQGQVGIGTTSVYSDASTNLTLPGSIGFKNGTDPMMYVYETGSANFSRAVISHSPGFADYGIAYNDSDDAFLFLNAGTTKMKVDLAGSADVLDVAGNVSVGTGTTGCVKDADGTVIAGTCSSDRRFKTDIKPFSDVLDQLVKLEPVHFHWRADEYPDRNFGDRQSYGLIAQDVEEVMPELVTEDEEGFLAVRYSKLPLLLLQAVKEQQQQIELLKAELASLRAEAAEARAQK